MTSAVAVAVCNNTVAVPVITGAACKGCDGSRRKVILIEVGTRSQAGRVESNVKSESSRYEPGKQSGPEGIQNGLENRVHCGPQQSAPAQIGNKVTV